VIDVALNFLHWDLALWTSHLYSQHRIGSCSEARDRSRIGKSRYLRLLATLSGFFGALALGLAVIGLYGVMSYNVARRRNEIGIRMALGAEQARVLRMVLGEVAILLAAGLALGLAVAVFSTRLLAGFRYRLEPNDPTTLVTACVVLAVSAVVAGLLPARRAANLDPMTALREE